MISGFLSKLGVAVVTKLVNALAGVISLWLKRYLKQKRREKETRLVIEALKKADTKEEREDAARLVIDSF